MSARRLLVLCYFYPPLAGGGVHRVLGFTRHLPALGWSATVVCASQEDYWVLDETLAAAVPAEVETVRVRGGSALGAWLSLRRGGTGRRSGRSLAGLKRLSDWWLLPDSYVGWSRRAGRVAARLMAERGIEGPRGFDALLSSSPPDSVHLAALGLHRRFGVPWVADFRDAWMGLTFRKPPTPWHRARHAALERSVLSQADAVVAVSRTHAAMLERRAREDGIARLVYLPNGYEPASEDAPGRAPTAGKETQDPAGVRHFRAVFTGTLSNMPDTEVFLEALHDVLARRTEARRHLRVSLVGPFDSDYADRAIALGLTGIVEFEGSKSHRATRMLQRAADLLLLWMARGLPSMVPGKLYEYLAAGRPLLAVLEPGEEAAEMVRSAGGVVVRPGDRVALAAEIERRYQAWRDGTEAPPRTPPWLAEHTRERLTARLVGVLDDVVEHRA